MTQTGRANKPWKTVNSYKPKKVKQTALSSSTRCAQSAKQDLSRSAKHNYYRPKRTRDVNKNTLCFIEHFSPLHQDKYFKNTKIIVDPDETAHNEPSHLHLIWIYIVCYSVLDLQLSPFWHKWMCPNTEMEESISETQCWKGQHKFWNCWNV